MTDIEDDGEVKAAHVAWLMESFKAAFDKLANHAGYTPARGYEMLNALALEAAAIIGSTDDAVATERLRRYFLTALGASLDEGKGRRH